MDDAYAVQKSGMRIGDMHFFALDKNRTAVGRINAAEYFYERRFSGTVFSEQCVNFSGTYIKIYIIKRFNSRK